MIFAKSRALRAFCAALIVLSACQDVPTAVVTAPARASSAGPGSVTIQGCVTDGDAGCPLDPIVVIAPPPELPPCDACNYYPGGRGGDAGDGDWGGGTGGETVSPYEQGPLAWIACIGAGLTAIGGGMLSYVSVEQYYGAIRTYASARLRYEYATTVPEQSQYYAEMLAAESNVNLMTVALAGSASVTVGGLLAVVGLCSPGVLFPTP